jgi:uncharacterized membrane protein
MIMDWKTQKIVFGALFAGVIITMVLAAIPVGSTVQSIVMLAVAIGVAATIIWALWKRRQERKAGIPMADERSRRIEGRAGYYTFLFSIWFMLGLSWAVEEIPLPDLKVRHALAITLLGTAAFYFIMYWHFSRKGDVQ